MSVFKVTVSLFVALVVDATIYPRQSLSGNILSNRVTREDLSWDTFSGCAQCLCIREEATIDCSGKLTNGRLPDVESLPNSDVKIFRYNNSGVMHVDYGYFTAFPHITDIQGENNFIREPFLLPSTITSIRLFNNSLTSTDLFNSSVTYNWLKLIDLSSNDIQVVRKDAFQSFPQLELLSLKTMRNGIRKLETHCIRNLPSLQDLSLEANTLRALPSDAIKNLSSPGRRLCLNLENNKLSEVPENFLDLPHLTCLWLDFNEIEIIHPLAFHLTPQLISIGLAHNKLTRVEDGTFNLSAPLVLSIDLDANKLSTISGGPFRKGMIIHYFTLIGNGLRHIDRSLFTTVNIVSLDISFNNLTSLQDIVAVLHEGKLKTFTAVNNKFTVVPAGAFQGLTTLVSV